MRIIVTGAGGFVGRAVVELLSEDCDVIPTDVNLHGCAGIEGDLADPAVRKALMAKGCDAIVHLATIPGGAAEADPEQAKRVNVDTTMALSEAAAAGGTCPRFIFASSIAVFGEITAREVNDSTAIAPKLIYGAHKAMMEHWLDTQTRRGALSALSLRLSGIVARPSGGTGFKSAFMSDVFHALNSGSDFTLPVSPDATSWLMSRYMAAWNIRHALSLSVTGAITLPALRVRMADLVQAIAASAKVDPSHAQFAPDAAIEPAFGRLPPLATEISDRLGFKSDGSLERLVTHVLHPPSPRED